METQNPDIVYAQRELASCERAMRRHDEQTLAADAKFNPLIAAAHEKYAELSVLEVVARGAENQWREAYEHPDRTLIAITPAKRSRRRKAREKLAQAKALCAEHPSLIERRAEISRLSGVISDLQDRHYAEQSRGYAGCPDEVVDMHYWRGRIRDLEAGRSVGPANPPSIKAREDRRQDRLNQREREIRRREDRENRQRRNSSSDDSGLIAAAAFIGFF